MAIESVVNSTSSDPLAEVVLSLGRIALFLQAIGVIVFLWIVYHIVALYFNRKRRLHLESIENKVARIERKVDKISKKLKV